MSEHYIKNISYWIIGYLFAEILRFLMKDLQISEVLKFFISITILIVILLVILLLKSNKRNEDK